MSSELTNIGEEDNPAKKRVARIIWNARHEGISYAVRRALTIIYYFIRESFHEYYDYPLTIILGPERAFKVRVAIFRFMCEHKLFGNRQKALWLGRRIRHHALKVTYIDPCRVKYQVRRGLGPSPYIQDGDWDLGQREFRWNNAVIQLFINNVPASDTEEYGIMKKAMENKDWRASRGCRTLEDIDVYFKTLKDIYQDMSNGRYRPSGEVQARYRNKNRRYYPDEICMSIDRNGEYIIERGGGHRLSIAQLLKIEKIPVIIIGKHYLYVKSKRDWISCHP